MTMPLYLLVVVDTEEEFNWHKPFNSSSTSTEHAKALPQWQAFFDEFQVKPCYVTDYPFAQNEEAMTFLADFHHDGRAEVGAHCHPWVNPPLRETVCPQNSYPGNLTESLEREKITKLTELLTQRLGVAPKTYKAGRYGFGPNTADIITSLGYDVDLSPCPAFDMRDDGGPDYRYTSPAVQQISTDHGELTVFPLSAGLVGWGGPLKRPAFSVARRLEQFRLPGILSRSRFCDRLKLSPEGFTPSEHRMIADDLISQGYNILSWTFHSPSMVAGYTPYVRNEKELTEFKRSFELFFDYAVNTLGATPITPSALKKELNL